MVENPSKPVTEPGVVGVLPSRLEGQFNLDGGNVATLADHVGESCRLVPMEPRGPGEIFDSPPEHSQEHN
jgi:hypothetical protein